jgi:hypothetical protein
MGYFFAGVIVCGVLLWLVDHFWTEVDLFWGPVITFFAGPATVVVYMACFAPVLPTVRYVAETKLLHNLYDGSSVNGSFFLGTGSIKETEYFFYNVEQNGLINPERMQKYNDDVYIAEDGLGNPRLEKVCTKTVGYETQDRLWGMGYTERNCIQIFHIPQGSVDSGYMVK